jgi:hypothetical protein
VINGFVSFPDPGTMDLLGHRFLIISWTDIITGILIRNFNYFKVNI